MKFLGNFKVIAAILAIVVFMMILYGYNRSERKKLAKNMQQQLPQQQQQQRQTVQGMKAAATSFHPNLGKQGGGCGCGKK